jgi:hypothetical protein
MPTSNEYHEGVGKDPRGPERTDVLSKIRQDFGVGADGWPTGARNRVPKGGSEKRTTAEKREHIRHCRPSGISIAEGCRLMGIGRSTFYAIPDVRAHDLTIVAEMKTICDEFEAYGYRRVDAELRHRGINFYPRRSKLRWQEQLGNIERKKLAPKEDPEDQQKPELLSKSRMHDLEQRRVVGFELTASEEQELRDLRERYPEFAAVMDLMDLSYLYHWRREVEIARKAGLNTVAMFEQADVICLRFRDPTKFTTESDAEESRRVRNGKATEAASLEP